MKLLNRLALPGSRKLRPSRLCVQRRAALACLVLGFLFCGGCSVGLVSADHAFEAGEYAQAASRYEAFLEREASGPGRERALFRLALLYSSPETPVHDRERAYQLREVLAEEFPGGPYGSWISWQFSLERRIETLQDELVAHHQRSEELQSRLQEVEAEHASSLGRGQDLERQLEDRLAEMRALERELAKAQDEATSQKERMARLKEALELLKKIDIKRPAKPSPPSPAPPVPPVR